MSPKKMITFSFIKLYHTYSVYIGHNMPNFEPPILKTSGIVDILVSFTTLNQLCKSQ